MAVKSFLRSDYSRNIATLVTGTALAQAIPVAISPILTRLFTPEDFGLFATYFSITMVASVIATAKFEMAIVLPADREESRSLMKFSILISIIVSAVIFLLVLISRSFMANILNIAGLEKALFLLPFSVLLIGCTQSLQYFLNRDKNFRGMASSRISRGVSYSGFSLLTGVLKSGGMGLIVSDLFAQFISFFVMSRKEYFDGGIIQSKQTQKDLINRYINFPKFLIPSGLLEKIAAHAPVFLLSSLFHSTVAVGFYSLAQRTIIAPADLITRAISDVFRQEASETYARQKECKEVFMRTFKRLLSIAIIPFTIGFFIIEDVFAFVFGEDWRVAGHYARIMMPMFFLQFVVSPLSIMFVVAEKQKYDLMMQTFLLTTVLVSFFIGHYVLNSIPSALRIFTTCYSLKYVIEFIFSFRFSRGSVTG